MCYATFHLVSSSFKDVSTFIFSPFFSKGLLSPGGCLEPLTVNTPCFEPEVMDVKVEVDVINVVISVLFLLLTVKAIKPDDI